MVFLPPPDDPQADTTVVSNKGIKWRIVLSYHPPFAINCLISSRGGYDP